MKHGKDGRFQPDHEARKEWGEMVELYKKGWSLNMLAQHLKISSNSVRWRLNRLGIEIRKDFRLGSKVGEHWNDILKLYAEGWSLKRIARRFGLNAANIYSAFKIRGIKTRTSSEALKNAARLGTTKFGYGSANLQWKGGINYHSAGYWRVRKPDHPRAGTSGYVFEHVLVAEAKLGRFLNKGEVVHHLNGCKTDNRPENLRVMRQSDHLRKHHAATVESRKRNENY